MTCTRTLLHPDLNCGHVHPAVCDVADAVYSMLPLILSTILGGSALVAEQSRAVAPRMQLGVAPSRAAFAYDFPGVESKLNLGCELCGTDGCMCREPFAVVESNSYVCELCGGVDGCMCRGPAPASFKAVSDAFGA